MVMNGIGAVVGFAQGTQQLIAGVILVVVFVSFVRGRIAPEITALCGMVAMVFSGILPVRDALATFADRSILMIAAMLVVCLALEKTGVVARMGVVYERLAGNSPTRGLWLLMLLCGGASSFLNNTSIVVIFLPIVMGVCRRQGTPPSRLLIPLSFATVCGGMITLVGTSTNMNVVTAAEEKGLNFSLFEIAPLGLAVFFVGFVYMGLFSRRLLPDRVALSSLLDGSEGREYLTRAYVTPASPLVGRLFTETPLARVRGIRLIEVIRDGGIVQSQFTDLKLEAWDQLILKGKLEDVMSVRATQGIEMVPQETLGLEGVRTEKAVLMEAVLGPGSVLLHKSIKQLNFRQRYGVIIVAVHRMGVNLRERFQDMRFMIGDALLLEGPPEQMNQLFKERGFINLTKPKDTRMRVEKAPLAIAIMVAVILFGALSEIPNRAGEGILDGWFGFKEKAAVAWDAATTAQHDAYAQKIAATQPNATTATTVAEAIRTTAPEGDTGPLGRDRALARWEIGFEMVAIVGALLVILTRCIDVSEIYEGMEWRLLFMIAGTIAIGRGMEACRLTNSIGDSLAATVGQGNPWLALSAVYLVSVILTEFLNNNTVAVIFTPIAISIAQTLGVDPKPFAVAVMFGATLAFSTPIGYQTNLLVYNAGGYKFGDFARIGIPLTLMLWMLCSWLIPLIWPFYP
jgi:di/tricarboxylate transporter